MSARMLAPILGPALALALTPLAACSFGFGSSYVGQWNPRDEVDFEACLQDEAGRCIDRKQVKRHVPGRKFWGVIATLPGSMGGSRATSAGESETLLRVEPSLEFLRGKGRWAVGLRAGVVTEGKAGQADIPEAEQYPGMTAVALTAIGRVSVHPRLSVYGGAGYSPFAVRGDERTFLSGRLLAGFQFPLVQSETESYLMLTVEIDRMYVPFDEAYRSTGITANLGLFF